jgi:hypothetical protein
MFVKLEKTVINKGVIGKSEFSSGVYFQKLDERDIQGI